MAAGLGLWGCPKPPHKMALEEARTLAKHEDYAKAIKVLNDAIQASPDQPALHRERLRVLLLADNAQMAEQAFVLFKKKFSRSDPILMESLADKNPVVRAAAAKTLAEIKDIVALKPLCTATKDADAEVRRAAVVALGRLRDRAASPFLIERLGDEAWEVRGDAASALGLLGEPAAVKPLFKAVEDADGYVRSTAASALADLASEANRAEFVQQLQSSSREIRLSAALALARIKGREGVAIIYQEMKTSPDAGQRRRCIEALARMHDKADLAALQGMFADRDSTVRFAAVDSMRFVPDATSVPLLRRISTDAAAPASLRDHAGKVAVAIEQWVVKQAPAQGK